MSDSVKQKRLIHCRCFIGGFLFHMQGISDLRFLLLIYSRNYSLGEAFDELIETCLDNPNANALKTLGDILKK